MQNHITPLFSVLVANYNNGKYLLESIESVKKQTYKNWEIIIVDDASTDNSELIYQQLKHEKDIKVFKNAENKGCGYTKRKCVELAEGEICAFLDPDDLLEQNALEEMVKAHQEKEDYSLIYSGYKLCDNNLNLILIPNLFGKIPDDRTSLGYKEKRIAPLAAFKKKYYLMSEGINPILKRAVDQDLYYKLEEVGKLHFINQLLYIYRIHNSSISNYENRSKAVYWNMIVQKETILRRKKLHYKNDFTIRQLVGRYQAFVMLRAKEKIERREYKKLAYIIFSGIHFLNYDLYSLKLLKYFIPAYSKNGGRY